ncbi:MAG: ABC transporter substrate-binding protein [Chloroflexota bacterium]
MRWTPLFAAALIASFLAACGGASPSPAASGAAQIAAYQGADRQAKLEAGARAEGAVTWYTTLAGDVIETLKAGFQQKYPYIKIEVLRADEAALATRATQEAEAGKQTFDVIECAPVTTGVLQAANLLTPFFSPELAKLSNDLKPGPGNDLAGAATARIAYAGFGWNTTLLPDSAVPKTQADLLNPALKGKLGLTGSTTGSNWVGGVLHVMGDDAGKKFLSQVASQQQPKVYQVSGQALMDLIVKGEVPAAPTIFLAHVQAAQLQNAPVKWAPLDTAIANLGQDSLAAKAPHPNAGLLFIDWLLSDGATILKQQGFFPGTNKVTFPYWAPDASVTPTQAEQNLNSWTELFKTTFR